MVKDDKNALNTNFTDLCPVLKLIFKHINCLKPLKPFGKIIIEIKHFTRIRSSLEIKSKYKYI